MSWELLVIVPIGLLGALYATLTIAEGCLAMFAKWQGTATTSGRVRMRSTEK